MSTTTMSPPVGVPLSPAQLTFWGGPERDPQKSPGLHAAAQEAAARGRELLVLLDAARKCHRYDDKRALLDRGRERAGELASRLRQMVEELEREEARHS